jgi:molecular chaperone GrpE (heat shock protein)
MILLLPSLSILSIAAVMITLGGVLCYFVVRHGVWANISTADSRARASQAGPLRDISQRAKSLEDKCDALVKEIAEARSRFSEEMRQLVEVLATQARKNAAAGHHSDAADAQAYADVLETVAPLTNSILELRAAVAALEQCASNPEMAAVLKEYSDLSGFYGKVAERQAQVLGPPEGDKMRELEAEWKEGRMAPQEYLQALYDCTARIERRSSLQEEYQELLRLAGSFEERFLAWIDSVTEMRDAAQARREEELYRACACVIEQASEIMETREICLIDVPVGSTRFDDRLHELGGTVPRPDMVPETVIGVRKLGHKRKGVLVRKPQVLVASASS